MKIEKILSLKELLELPKLFSGTAQEIKDEIREEIRNQFEDN